MLCSAVCGQATAVNARSRTGQTCLALCKKENSRRALPKWEIVVFISFIREFTLTFIKRAKRGVLNLFARGTPRGGASAGHTFNAACHMRLVGKTALRCDICKRIIASTDRFPCLACAGARAKRRRRNPENLCETAGQVPCRNACFLTPGCQA